MRQILIYWNEIKSKKLNKKWRNYSNTLSSLGKRLACTNFNNGTIIIDFIMTKLTVELFDPKWLLLNNTKSDWA